MAFFDDMKKKLQTGNNSVPATPQDSIQSMIQNLEGQKDAMYIQLGKKYYEMAGDGEQEVNQENILMEMNQIMEGIKAMDQNIMKYREELNALRGIMICKECKKEIPVGSLFCNFCGTKVEVQQVQNNNVRKCSCGAELFEGQLFCMSCGKPVEESAKPVEDEMVNTPASDGEHADEDVNGEEVMKAPLRCSNCGEELEPEQVFCSACGQKVGASSVEQVPAKRVCPNCGEEAEDGHLFCISCGSPLQ